MPSFLSVLALATLIAAKAAPQINPAEFPAAFEVAPENPEWTRKVVEGANIPNIPLTTPGVGAVWNPREITNCNGNPNSWALTYDDGPGALTANIVQHHKANGIAATWFVTGQAVVQRSDVVRQIAANGFEIAMHSWSHPWSTSISNGQFVAEVVYTARAIYRVTGRVPRYIRLPYGDIDDRIRALLKSLDVIPILWNFDSEDSLGKAAQKQEIFRAAVSQDFPSGVISLEHDLEQPAASGVNAASEIVKNSKYTTVTMSQCLNKQNVGGAYTTCGKLYELVTGVACAGATTPGGSNGGPIAPGTTNPGTNNQGGNTNIGPNAGSQPSAAMSLQHGLFSVAALAMGFYMLL